MPSSLDELFASLAGATNEPTKPLPEATIATLREAFARYEAPCPFKPGDLVTPRAGYPYFSSGEPFIVLEVAKHPIRPMDESEPASLTFGPKLDVRVLGPNRDKDRTFTAWWQESWMLEPYTGPGL